MHVTSSTVTSIRSSTVLSRAFRIGRIRRFTAMCGQEFFRLIGQATANRTETSASDDDDTVLGGRGGLRFANPPY